MTTGPDQGLVPSGEVPAKTRNVLKLLHIVKGTLQKTEMAWSYSITMQAAIQKLKSNKFVNQIYQILERILIRINYYIILTSPGALTYPFHNPRIILDSIS